MLQNTATQIGTNSSEDSGQPEARTWALGAQMGCGSRGRKRRSADALD